MINNNKSKNSVFGFLFKDQIRVPINLREYYISCELIHRGYEVLWFCEQASGHYPFLFDVQKIFIESRNTSHTNKWLYPLHLVKVFKHFCVKFIWISGWYERNPLYIFYILCILKIFGLRVLYDPIDPIYEYEVANNNVKMTIWKKIKTLILVNAIYRLSDITLMVTEELKKAVVKKGAPENKIYVAMWGTDISRFNSQNCNNILRRSLNLDDKFIIGWLGTMSLFKGIEEILIPIIKTIPKYIPEAFFLIGGKGHLERVFTDLSDAGDVPFKLLGEISYDDAPAFTSSIDLYLVPTNTSTEIGKCICPVKIFDSLAMGKPVIATTSKATEFLHKEVDSVILIDFNFHNFFNAILKCYYDYSNLKEKCDKNKLKIIKYSHQSTSEKIAEIIEKNLIAS